ncbi:MAG: hypothetical protein JNL62_11625 [Bryobacterales bacterium]|nr:hypothetical protein [Bryobacterales bacterium]
MAEEKKPRDRWDKLQIVISALMPLALFALGFWGNHALQQDQRRRAYVELLSRREEAESNLRKDMFAKVIEQFVGTGKGDLDTRVLNLELLAYNFHESIDLEPLLKQVYVQALNDTRATSDQRKRLQRLAQDIAGRELEALRESGCVHEGYLEFDTLQREKQALKVIQGYCGGVGTHLPAKWFRVDVTTNPEVTDMRKQTEVDVVLSVRPNEKALGEEKRLTFTVSPFDFPMIDNVRLEDRSRVSVVMTRLDEGGVTLSLVYFPGSRTSLKDKPFHDEVLRTLEDPTARR